jgi:hypothetical protein
MMLAQRYPTAYDGIAANAPAMYWNQVLSSIHWPYQVMLDVGAFPHLCEVDAIRAAAVSACDGLDGVLDGIVANVDECLASFDPSRLVGAIARCGNETSEVEVRITEGAVAVVNQTWHGIATPAGEQIWPGLTPSTHLTGSSEPSRRVQGPIDTLCENGNCTGIPHVLGVPWIQQFLLGVPDADLSKLSNADFHDLMHVGKRYRSIVGTDDPDLSRFRDAGGKLVTYHGLVSLPYLVKCQYACLIEKRGPGWKDANALLT